MARTRLNADNSGQLDIICKRGDSFKIKFTFKANGEAVDLSGNTFTLRIYGADSFPIVMQAGTIVGNTVKIERTPAQMDELKGLFTYEVKRDFGTQTRKAIISGKLTVK